MTILTSLRATEGSEAIQYYLNFWIATPFGLAMTWGERMYTQTKRRSRKAGLAPGTLVHIGEKKSEVVDIGLIHYTESNFEEKQLKDISECSSYKDLPGVTWINIDGIHDTTVIENIGKIFEIHPLVLEDILNTSQRPKLEDYEKYAYIVLKILELKSDNHIIVLDSDQVSMILGSNYVITFLEKKSFTMDCVKERIKSDKGRIRRMGADYLCYSIADCIVDNYFGILEKFGDKIDELEEQLVIAPKQKLLHRLHRMRKAMLIMRKSIWPMRELINSLYRRETLLVGEHISIYLRDLYDHTIQIIDNVETYREMLTGMLDTYLSSVSNRMNNIIRVLTIIATIFMPLTFVAGVYGMNFKYMPELGWKLGYPFSLSIMLAIALTMLTYFKRKKWF